MFSEAFQNTYFMVCYVIVNYGYANWLSGESCLFMEVDLWMGVNELSMGYLIGFQNLLQILEFSSLNLSSPITIPGFWIILKNPLLFLSIFVDNFLVLKLNTWNSVHDVNTWWSVYGNPVLEGLVLSSECLSCLG